MNTDFGMDLFDKTKFDPKTEFVGKSVMFFDVTDSTNTRAKQSDCKDGTIFVAKTQTSGRGRLGKNWVSDDDNNIYMSIVTYPDIKAEKIMQITLLTGIAVCETLNAIANTKFGIKWPNDIVHGGKKVCGILTEGVIANGIATKVVCGIGINVNAQNFSIEIADIATSMHIATGKKYDRVQIVKSVAENFEKYYTILTQNGIDEIIERYKSLCVNIGRVVVSQNQTKKIEGTAIDVSSIGELVIETENGNTQNINSGDVSVRGMYGYAD